jgi:hypothetical protein
VGWSDDGDQNHIIASFFLDDVLQEGRQDFMIGSPEERNFLLCVQVEHWGYLSTTLPKREIS